MDAYNNVGIDSIETAKNLKKLRIENNLKLKQVRDAIGLSAEQTVCSWESKTHPKLPSIDNALNLARLYGVRLDQLYKTRPVKTGSPEKVDQEIRDRITISMRMGEFEEFFDDMRMEGVYPVVGEGYRSEQQQQEMMQEKIDAYLAEGYSERKARKEAEKWVAKPNYSEHQLGLALDINADKSRCDNDRLPVAGTKCLSLRLYSAVSGGQRGHYRH